MAFDINVLGGNSNPALLKAICNNISKLKGWNDFKLTQTVVDEFSDGEPRIYIEDNLRANHVFVVQSTCPPVHKNLMELLTIIDACVRASVSKITAVIPYYGYGRQDRKVIPRTPITASLVAKLLRTAGANALMCVDLHAGQIQGFFDGPVDHLFARPVLIEYLRKQNLIDEDTILVAPDVGATANIREFAKRLNNCDIAIIDKRHGAEKESTVMKIVGDVAGKNVLIGDDMIDTAGTLCKGATALLDAGAKKILAFCTHAVLSSEAVKHIQCSAIAKLIVTDTIPLNEKAIKCNKIEQISVADLIAKAIVLSHHGSVSSLFD